MKIINAGSTWGNPRPGLTELAGVLGKRVDLDAGGLYN